ncbi:MAG: phospho-sugar mutase, partial [Rikenellaceae bacterium]
ITASHNPKEYNGYKAYWAGGSQVIAPHDANIIDRVNQITDPSQVKFSGGSGEIVIIGEDMDNTYLDMIEALSLSKDAVARNNNFKIVYTPIHGTGVRLVPAALRRCGFTNIYNVPEQDVNDGNFPTVVSPNPEEPAAMKMGVDKAIEVGADLVMATDPDADRQAVAVRNDKGEFVLLNGNQSAALLTYYLCRRWSELGKIDGKQFVVKTIVTTDLIVDIAKGFGVESFNVLTGFKYIADIIAKNEGKKQFIAGGEESFGYLVGDSVRDKCAVSSLCMVAECAAWAADQGMTLWQLLVKIYEEFGLYKESLISITKPGQSGVAEIQQMMSDLRANPPRSICGEAVVEVRDYQAQTTTMADGSVVAIDQPKSNVLQFVTDAQTIVSARPSGTEPKIKFYFGVRGELASSAEFDAANDALAAKIETIKKELNLI